MRSEKQREASRANGAKSRGPVTAQGKSISSRNATRHGVLADILTLKIELRDEFLALCDKLFDEFQPSTPFEESLVEGMVAAQWRLNRIWSIETAALDLEIDRQTSTNNPAGRVANAIRELSHGSRTLDVLSRYEFRYERQYLRFHRRLMEIRGQRPPNTPSPFLVPKPQPGPQPEPVAEMSNEPNEPAEIVEITKAAPAARSRWADNNTREIAVPVGASAAAGQSGPNSGSQPEEKKLNSAFSMS